MWHLSDFSTMQWVMAAISPIGLDLSPEAWQGVCGRRAAGSFRFAPSFEGSLSALGAVSSPCNFYSCILSTLLYSLLANSLLLQSPVTVNMYAHIFLFKLLCGFCLLLGLWRIQSVRGRSHFNTLALPANKSHTSLFPYLFAKLENWMQYPDIVYRI